MNVSTSSIFIPTGKYCQWHKRTSIDTTAWVCGYAYNGNSLYEADEFAEMICKNVHEEWDSEVSDFLRQLNGNWALVVLKGNILYAACDRKRSYPLLYSQLSGDLRISDCITKVSGDHIQWSLKGVEDFLWAGYPAGTSTLIEGVYQILAGMYLRYDVTTKQKSLIEYFNFLPANESLVSEDQMSKRLSELLDEAIVRVGKIAHGRIVVPLSGGMDSRVIAACLKRNRFKDVLCFSYGCKGNADSEASKRVAEALGYEWDFIEYTPQTWSSCMFSQEMKDYLVFACNGCSMSTYNEWYAVKMLRERGRISAGDTFLPGHTSIAISGHNIPASVFNYGQSVDLKNIIKYIVQRRFSNWPGRPPERIGIRLLKQLHSGRNDKRLNYLEAQNLHHHWFWREWHSKCIVNCDRMYEFFGCNWLLPLWDIFLLDYYSTIPIGLRHRKRFFLRAAVENIFTDKLSILSEIPLAGKGNLSPRRTLELPLEERLTTAEKVKRYLLATRIGKMTQIVKQHISTKPTLRFPRHPLELSYSFTDGEDPIRYSVRQVFEKYGLSDILDCPECKSVFKFVDESIGPNHPFGLLSLYIFAHMRALIK